MIRAVKWRVIYVIGWCAALVRCCPVYDWACQTNMLDAFREAFGDCEIYTSEDAIAEDLTTELDEYKQE